MDFSVINSAAGKIKIPDNVPIKAFYYKKLNRLLDDYQKLSEKYEDKIDDMDDGKAKRKLEEAKLQIDTIKEELSNIENGHNSTVKKAIKTITECEKKLGELLEDYDDDDEDEDDVNRSLAIETVIKTKEAILHRSIEKLDGYRNKIKGYESLLN